MKNQHFTQDALLTSTGPGEFRVTFKGVEYLPTRNADAMGALLFGLRPKGIKFDCNEPPQEFLQLAGDRGYALHCYANRGRSAEDNKLLSTSVVTQQIAAEVDAAVALAPTAKDRKRTRELIVENLGPDSAVR